MKFALILLTFTFCFPLAAQSDIEQHKKKCIDKIIQATKHSRNYPLNRVIKTIKGSDSDYIPKVPGAGEIFEENGIKYQRMHNGVKVHQHCYYGKWMTDVIHALRGHHEPQEEKAFYEVLKYIPKGATMLELGAYWCYYSLWFAHDVPNAKNYVIEPLATNLEIGKKNFSLNGKQAHFFQGYLGATSVNVFKDLKRYSVDEFMKANKIDHVNILHSDIQGAEYDMLTSCEEAIKNRKIDYFFISTHGPKVHHLCKLFFLEKDFKILAEHEMAESCSYDGLIVARRKDVSGPDEIEIKKY